MNTATKVTVARIVLIPVVVAVYLIDFPWNKVLACLLFTLTACTDFIDGHIARSRNMVTDVGKFLDPIADKVLVLAFMFILVGDGTLPAPYGAIACLLAMSRDFIISGFRLMAVTKGVVISADVWGKLKTVLLDIGLAVLMISGDAVFDTYGDVAEFFGKFFYIAGSAILYAGVVLSIGSGVNYIVKNKQVMVTNQPAAEEEKKEEQND